MIYAVLYLYLLGVYFAYNIIKWEPNWSTRRCLIAAAGWPTWPLISAVDSMLEIYK